MPSPITTMVVVGGAALLRLARGRRARIVDMLLLLLLLRLPPPLIGTAALRMALKPAEQFLEEAARALALPVRERIAVVGDLRLGGRGKAQGGRHRRSAFDRGQKAAPMSQCEKLRSAEHLAQDPVTWRRSRQTGRRRPPSMGQ